MAIVENKAAARSYYEQVLNHGNMSAADAIFAPDIQFPLGNLSGADTVKDYIAAVRTAFPDVHFTVADLVAEGHSVSARWTLTGHANRRAARKGTHRSKRERARHYGSMS